VAHITPLGELCVQHLAPIRRLLVLTSSGLHVVRRNMQHAMHVDKCVYTYVQCCKQRPIDYLLRVLLASASLQPVEVVRDFCERFTKDQGCAMCFSLACGLPVDVGQSVTLDGPHPLDALNEGIQVCDYHPRRVQISCNLVKIAQDNVCDD
jgi:hypothetical protein